VKKTSDFSKFMVCLHGQGEGLSQCGHFSDKEGRVNFSQTYQLSPTNQCSSLLRGLTLSGKGD